MLLLHNCSSNISIIKEFWLFISRSSSEKFSSISLQHLKYEYLQIRGNNLWFVESVSEQFPWWNWGAYFEIYFKIENLKCSPSPATTVVGEHEISVSPNVLVLGIVFICRLRLLEINFLCQFLYRQQLKLKTLERLNLMLLHIQQEKFYPAWKLEGKKSHRPWNLCVGDVRVFKWR